MSHSKYDYLEKAANELYEPIIQELSSQSTKKYDKDKLTFEELTQWRHEKLPTILNQRFKDNDHTWLTKDELILLMDWKLAAGKFRPTLPKLIKSNEENDVIDITKSGFDILLQFTKPIGTKEYQSTVKDSIKKISQLRGVGPATASLMLSLLYKINKTIAPPFFSDESFIYYVIQPIRPQTPIKYNIKEYIEELLPVYFKILKVRNDLDMQLLERGAWSIQQMILNQIDKLINVKVPFEIKPLEELEITSPEPVKKKRKHN
ncbi:uncharacterized protein RJT21DRAFT_45536 [Scheffersomyces amazonensis]|uniref:uncharacterized protein n=1 Tax=Scheffersomyces amazonensis TaxID=1078765 RepID=UPI00315DE6C8